jgi:hypothetical protein
MHHAGQFHVHRGDFKVMTFSEGDVAIAVGMVWLWSIGSRWQDLREAGPGSRGNLRRRICATRLRMINFERREKARIRPALGVMRRTRRAVPSAATPSERDASQRRRPAARTWPFGHSDDFVWRIRIHQHALFTSNFQI